MDCSPPGFSVHEVFQARILEWTAFPSPGDLPHPRIKPMSTRVSCISRQIPYYWATKEAQDRRSQSWIHTRITRVVLKFCDAWTPAPPKQASIFREIIFRGIFRHDWEALSQESTIFPSTSCHFQDALSTCGPEEPKMTWGSPFLSPLSASWSTQAPIWC